MNLCIPYCTAAQKPIDQEIFTESAQTAGLDFIHFNGMSGEYYYPKVVGPGAALTLSEVSQGAAFGDVDNDGDVDVLVANNSGRTRLMINNVGSHKHWLGLRLINTANHDDHAARVAIYRKASPVLWRRVRSDGSYASSNDPRILVGLGDNTVTEGVRVYWNSGRVEEWKDIARNRYTVLREGTGKTLELKK